jgi:hypothetical protein
MNKEFVTYEQALALMELGFEFGSRLIYGEIVEPPLKSEVFRWFREKYELHYHIFPLEITASDKTGYRYSWEIYNHTPEWIAEDTSLLGSLTYEEAENATIDKLIELAKQQEK